MEMQYLIIMYVSKIKYNFFNMGLFSDVDKRESRNNERRRDDSDREKESKRERA